ncbi:MAG: hypothetical protein FGM28_13040 [Limnohabitans sp.]|nr:hypothetical protein [Limnohabitans sp.]
MLNLQIHYINLHDQEARRSALRANLAQTMPAEVAIHRVEAATPKDVMTIGLGGTIRDVEKACYLSHLRALQQACTHAAHAYILEDDAHLGVQSFARIGTAIAQLAQRGEAWDLLYTQFMPVKPEHMVELLRIRNECLHKNAQLQADTRRMLLAGSCAYVVNASSKVHLRALLQRPSALHQPVDRYYWQLARDGKLQTRVAFPLPSSVAPEAVTSQIQEANKAQASLLWNVFMRLCAAERDLDSIEASLAPLAAQGLSPEAQAQAQAWLAPITEWLHAQEVRIMHTLLGYLAQPGFESLFQVNEAA